MSKPDWKELFGEDSDDEEIIIPPMPKFKSKIQRRDNIEEDIPEDIPEPEILSFKLDSNDDSTDVLFFNPEDSMEEAAKGIEGMKLQDIEKIEKAEEKKEKTTKCPPGKVLNPKTGRCVKAKDDSEETKKVKEPKKAKESKKEESKKEESKKSKEKEPKKESKKPKEKESKKEESKAKESKKAKQSKE